MLVLKIIRINLGNLHGIDAVINEKIYVSSHYYVAEEMEQERKCLNETKKARSFCGIGLL